MQKNPLYKAATRAHFRRSVSVVMGLSMVVALLPAALQAKDKSKVLNLNSRRLDKEVPQKKFKEVADGLILDDFSDSTVDEFPLGWMSRKESSIPFYNVAQEKDGKKYLHAEAKKAGGSIFLRAQWDIKKYPILEWRWRPLILPIGGMEKKQRTNDATLGVYIIFPLRLFIPDSLKYSWSTTLPVGTVFSNGFSRNKIEILRSGPKRVGEWVVERRNIYQDYVERFKRRPEGPIAIGLITDADDTKSHSAGDYDYFKVMPGKLPEFKSRRPSSKW